MRRSALALLIVASTVFGATSSPGVTVDWVNVCDGCLGIAAYPYQIGKYEVTNAQYAEFLNAVAVTDTNALYNTNMGSNNTFGGITRSGSSGSYSYAVKSGFANKPVNYVSFWDAVRFANWLQNGQPTGTQSSLTTEDGTYTLTPEGIAANSVLRNPIAGVCLPSDNEWYRAAYYSPTPPGFLAYPAGSSTPTSCTTPTLAANSANCDDPFGDLANVGSYPNSLSPWGTLDQGGNVWEWTEQISVTSSTSRFRRGGAYNREPFTLAADYFDDQAAWAESEHTGFRVALSPKVVPVPFGDAAAPVVVALLAMTGLLGLADRQRRAGRT
jgi:formylglycine-generating enzyme required for sulfatase activity